jgi:hypothetical protein
MVAESQPGKAPSPPPAGGHSLRQTTQKGRPVKPKKFLVAVPVAALLVGGGTAAAALTGSAGGAQIQVQNRGQDLASLTSSPTFVDLPGAAVVTSVPGGRTQLITARFTAESSCQRALPALGGWCSVRIVAQRVGGAAVELSPAAGLDYALDSVRGADQFEGHAMERSIRLPAGTYVIRAQRAVTSPAITFRLDDWHLAVEKSV